MTVLFQLFVLRRLFTPFPISSLSPKGWDLYLRVATIIHLWMRLDGEWRISSFGINHTAPFSGGKAGICKMVFNALRGLIVKICFVETAYNLSSLWNGIKSSGKCPPLVMDFFLLFFFFSSTDNKGKMNCVNTVAAPWGDSPQIKVHFMTQIEGRTWWYEAYLSGKCQAASIDLLFYSSAAGQPAVYILTFPRWNASAVIFHQGQISTWGKATRAIKEVYLHWCLWIAIFDSLLVSANDRWSQHPELDSNQRRSLMKLMFLVLTSYF